MKHDLRYGGTTADKKELNAIIKSATNSVKTGNWQSGKEAQLMEKETANFLGLKHGILTTSGSCAGLLALSALELPGGSEVIISAVTFPTIFNIILQCGLVPVVVDAKVGTYTFDVDEVERAITSKTGAIIAIHPVGNPCDMSKLMKMVRRKQNERLYKGSKQKIYVIEDNCDGFGGTIGSKAVGSFGDISFTSFHAAHIVSMGVGGGIYTNDKVLAEKVRMYRDWGRQANTTKKNTYKSLPEDYDPRFIYEKIGYNFQILELQASMGRVQMKRLKEIKRKRKANVDYLNKHLAYFEEYGDLILPLLNDEKADPCWFAYPITTCGDRGKLVKHLESRGIETRSMFSGNICAHPAYKDSKYRVSGKLEEANYILKHSFWLTCHPRLTKSDLKYIVKAFDDFYAKTS